MFKEAWRYRDYVIDAFNKDVPYDRFIREQLAGDLLPAANNEERQRQIVATTYLMLGNTNLENQDKKLLRMDFIDEQLDAVTKGFLAQTVTCARCHDHKFDPIPTKDYYALAAIFRNVKALKDSNVSEWTTIPLPVPGANEAELKLHETRIADLQAQVTALKKKTPATKATGVLAIKDIPGIVIDDASAKKVGVWQDSTHSGHYIGKGYTHDQDADKGKKTLTFQPESIKTGKYEVRLAYSEGTNRAPKVPVTVFSGDGEKTIEVNMMKVPPIDGRYISLGTYNFEQNGQCFVIVANEGSKGHVTPDAVVFIPEAAQQEQAQPKPKEKNNLAALEAELKKLREWAEATPGHGTDGRSPTDRDEDSHSRTREQPRRSSTAGRSASRGEWGDSDLPAESKWPARIGELDRFRTESAHSACDGEPHLAFAFRCGNRAHRR